ncbi:MAG: transposase [Deltaproteobacteria bacterium]|nr:transposase [Deltaproteobacteria bacterium]
MQTSSVMKMKIAVKLVTEQGYKLSEAARNLGIHPGLLGRWKL